MDEVAKAAGETRSEFRRGLMEKYPKHLAVLNATAERRATGASLAAGVHRGVAQFMGYGSYSAAVAEVSVSAKGKLKVHRTVLGGSIAATPVNQSQIRRRCLVRWPMGSPPRSTAECRSRRTA